MRNFLFEGIGLLSRRDQRALSVGFDPRKNLIVGRNHTGKSSIIKSLFLTLGARPKGELQHWDESTISLVTFSVDGQKYAAVYQNGNRALFDVNGKLLVAATTHFEWTEAFSRSIGFNLVLTDKESETVPADSRCFFLPFYINQDGSWQGTWDTFTGLQQYRAPVGVILDYFSGIKPPEYYELNAKRTQSHRALEELQKESRFLNRARERFGKSMALSGPKVRPDNFELEIARLTVEVTDLNRQQEKLRDLAVRERELVSNIQLQIQLAADALQTYDSDASFLRDRTRETLTCPTCGAEHTESFLDLLTYAEDARVLRELIARLRRDAVRAAEQYQKTQTQLLELDTNYRRVSEILDTRRGELQFGDVVNSMGAENAFRTFEEEAAILKKEVDQRLSEIDAFDARLKELTNVNRSKEILKVFREAYASALHKLNLPSLNVSRLRLTSRPDVSGSGGPRSILAYYAALWYTCLWRYGSFSVPLVIDAPNQQGQDDINLPKVLAFISGDLPDNSQIIVGSELDTPHPFNKKIELDQEYRVLQEGQYAQVGAVIDPFVKAMYNSLQREDVV